MQCSTRQRRARWLALAWAGCGLTGCVLGPNFQRPASIQAPAYTAAPLVNLEGQSGAQRLDATLSVPAQWWSLLQSPRLDATIRQALAVNRNLTAARATLEQSAELLRVNEAALYPNVALAASAGRVKYGAAFLGPEHFPPFTFYSVGPTVSYAFDYLGSAHRALEQQRSLHESQQHELDAAALSLSGQVAMQALAAAYARSQIETVDAVVADDGTNLKLVQDAFAAGGATRVDVLNAQSQLANDQTLLPPLRRELDLAEHALALLVGQAPAQWQAPDFRLAEFTLPERLPLTLPSELAHRRPDILAAEAQLHAATAAIGVATANLYPQLTVSANASFQATALRDLFDTSGGGAGITGALTAPLFNHGSLRAQQRAAVDAMKASLADYQQVVLGALGQVADALEDLNHDQELLTSEQSALTTSSDSLALTRESYSAGNTGVLQVLEAERQNQQARLGLVRAQVQRLEDSVQLLLSLGGRVPQPSEPLASDARSR